MPVDFDKAEEKVEKASSFFTSLNAFIKKHPIWSLIILAVLIEGGHLSWILGHDDESDEDYYYEEPYYEYDEDSYYETDTADFYQQTEY